MPHNINESVDFIEEVSDNPRQIVNDLAAAQPTDFMDSYRELSRRILSRPNGQRVGKALIDLIGTENELLNPVFENRSDNMNQIVMINQQEMTVKEYKGNRVVTLRDIDQVHARPDGTARKRFNDNKVRFIEGVDFFVRISDEAKREYGMIAPNGLTLLTESGYLMLVKSFTDDLAWDVQRQLVNGYFRVQEIKTAFEHLSPQLQVLISIETEQKRQAQEIARVQQSVDSIKEVVALDTNSWRKDAKNLINKIALSQGGYEYIKDVNQQVYYLLEQRMGVNLETRLTNKRRRMADNGVCKSKRDKLTKVDIIADDKKLIEGYIAIVKEMAVKSGVDLLAQTA